MSEISLDIENINPSEDLVVFTPRQGPFYRNRDAVVTYTLGKEFTFSGWDWVGLFHHGWESTRDYHAYQWAPTTPSHPKLKRRRSVLFKSKDIEKLSDLDDKFQFLYVTSGAHVVGVSAPFRFRSEKDTRVLFCKKSVDNQKSEEEGRKSQMCSGVKGDVRLDLLEQRISLQAGEKRKFKQEMALEKRERLHPYYVDLDSLEKCCLGRNKLKKIRLSFEKRNWTGAKKESKKFNNSKIVLSPIFKTLAQSEKINNKIHDHETLDTNFKTSVLDFLRIVEVNRIKVDQREKSRQQMVVPFVLLRRIFDVSGHSGNAWIQNMNNISRDVSPKKKIEIVIPIRPGPLSVMAMKESGTQSNACADGRKLTNDVFEIHERTREEKEVQVTKQTDRNSSLRNAFDILAQRGFKLVTDEDGNQHSISRIRDDTDSDGEWKLRCPKRMERMRRVISNQSSTIQNLVKSVIVQRDAIARQSKRLNDLRQRVSIIVSAKTHSNFNRIQDRYGHVSASSVEGARASQEKKLMEMTKVFRMMIQLRRESFRENNEWRLFARTNLGPIIASDRKEKAVQVQSLLPHSKSCNTRITRCPICGVTFSPNVDRRLIEEHIVFHERFCDRQFV